LSSSKGVQRLGRGGGYGEGVPRQIHGFQETFTAIAGSKRSQGQCVAAD